MLSHLFLLKKRSGRSHQQREEAHGTDLLPFHREHDGLFQGPRMGKETRNATGFFMGRESGMAGMETDLIRNPFEYSGFGLGHVI